MAFNECHFLMKSSIYRQWYFGYRICKCRAGPGARPVPFPLPHLGTVVTPGRLVDVELEEARVASYFEGPRSSKVSYVNFAASLPLRWINPGREAPASGTPHLVEGSREKARGLGMSSPTTPPSGMVVGDFVTPW